MMTSAFEKMQKHYQQPYLAAMDWKQNGGKVAGYFCDSVPEEMILAAGFFPLRITGSPQGSTDIARKHLIPRFATRETFVHSMLNKILSGEYSFLDFLIIPHSRDSIHRLYQLLQTSHKRNDLADPPELHFLDSPHTTFYSTGNYFRNQLTEFKKKLESWSGNYISNAALSQAIEITNESKRLHHEMARLRAESPSRISGVHALQIIGSSMFMLKEKHNNLLKKYLERINELPPQNKTRLFVSGSPVDNLQLYEIIESCDATVIAEDHCWGNRSFDVFIAPSLPPLEAVNERYLFKPPCPRMFPASRRIKYCIEKVEASNAHGVVFNVYEHDEAEAWEVPEKVKMLKNIGIESLHLSNQPYLIPETHHVKMHIEEFIKPLSTAVESI